MGINELMAKFTSSSTILTCPPPVLRSFLGRPANLPQISNPELELEVLSAPPEVIVGERIEFRITAYGFKQRATHEYLIASQELIVESQIEGPLRAWRHSQRIELAGGDACRLIDEIDFEPPGGMLGFLLTEARIRESLEEGMDFRYSTLQELIDSGAIS
jgi:ligand-binding SRPBCC domain-containing protein